MNQPERADSTEFERWLLDAGKGEKPCRALDRRMRRGLGLATFGAGAAWAAAGIAAVGVALGVGVTWRDEAPAEPRQARSATSPPVVKVAAAPAPPSAVPSTPPLRAAEPASPARPRISTTSSAPLSDGVRDEILLLDETRAALRAGNASAALATLNRYARRHPAGVLAPEASALREKALAATGSKPSPPR